jgi:hypothetical protein
MRTVAVLPIAVVAMLESSVTADAGTWCATYRRGVENCGYSSFEQCRATVSGCRHFAGRIPSWGPRSGPAAPGRAGRADNARL